MNALILFSFGMSAALLIASIVLWIHTKKIDARTSAMIRMLQSEVGAVRDGAIRFGRRQLRSERALERLLAQPDSSMTFDGEHAQARRA